LKKFRSQQITEFMLVVPILIAFFAVLTEFAFAINTQLVLTNTLKSSIAAYPYKVSQLNREFYYPSDGEIVSYITEELRKMKLDTNELSVKVITVDKNPVVVAEYKYKTGFTFSFLPALKNINMSSIAVFPYSKRSFKGYEDGINPSTSSINDKKSDEFQPPCRPCYVTQCARYETRTFYDEEGNVIGEETYCADYCSESQGRWWCVEDKEKKCPGSSNEEHHSCS